MKTFKHESQGPIIQTSHAELKHNHSCDGNLRCELCGRRMCSRCRASKRYIELGQCICLICAGVYQSNGIQLFND